MTWLPQLREVLSWLLLGAGSLVLVLSAGAILRMPTFFTRIHAAAVNETLGAGLILSGLAVQAAGRWDIVAKLLMVLVFLVITGPVSAHSLAQAALSAGVATGEYRRQQDRGDLDDQPGEATPSST